MNIKVRRMRGQWTAIVEKGEERRMWATGIACKPGNDSGKQKALEAARSWAQSIEWNSPKGPQVFSVWCQTVIDGQYNRKEIEGATYRGYNDILRGVRIWFKDKLIGDITPDDLRGYIEWMMGERELSASSAKKAYNLVAACLRRALAERIIEWNPAVAVKAPKSRLPEPNPLTEQSISVLIARLGELALTPQVVGAWIGLYTGMRRGEICALRWRSVDFERNLIVVSEAVGEKPGGHHIKGTKTGSDRLVPLTPQLVSVLSQRRLDMLEQCMAACMPMSPSLFVCGEIDGSMMSTNVMSRWWASHAAEWGLEGTQGKRPVFHDLRHTYATLAVRTLDLKTAQDILGHSTPIMTMRYADTEVAQVQRAAAPMGEAFPVVGKPGNSVLELGAM